MRGLLVVFGDALKDPIMPFLHGFSVEYAFVCASGTVCSVGITVDHPLIVYGVLDPEVCLGIRDTDVPLTDDSGE